MSPQHKLDDYDYTWTNKVGRITKILWYSSGVDVQLLAKCPYYEGVKYHGLGGIVLATAALAFLSGSYAFYVVFSPKTGIAINDQLVNPQALAFSIFFGIVWSLIIFNIDRFIISSTGSGDGKNTISFREFVQAIPRLIMAIIIGLCLAAPLEIRILKTEIDTELASRQKTERIRLDKKTDERIEKKKIELSTSMTAINEQIEKRVSTVEQRRQEIQQQRRALEDEAAGISKSKKSGRGPAYQDKKANLDAMDKEFNDWRKSSDEVSLLDQNERSKTLKEIQTLTEEIEQEKGKMQRQLQKWMA